MAGDDEKFDPFASADRTVIRPNPGGRRPVAPSVQPTAPPVQEFSPMPQASQVGTPQTPAPGMDKDDWMTGSSPQRAPAAPPPPPQMPREQGQASIESPVEGLHVPNKNPITRFAGPLLMLLANIRVTATQLQVGPMMESVARSVVEFEKDVLAAGVSEDQVVAAKFALCATADDIVQNMPGADRQLWTQYSMVSRYFQSRTSGVDFFNELAKVKANPALYYDLLELMHACLSLGFEGQYRNAGGGEATLQQIRRDVYQTMRNIKARGKDQISPHWRGQDIKTASSRFHLPVWAVAAMATIVALAVFVGYRLLLGDASEVLAADLKLLHPTSEVVITRPDFTPMSREVIQLDSSQLVRIRSALAQDIKANRLEANIEGDFISVRLLNTVLFASGRAKVKKSANKVIKRIALALNSEPNEIRIIGHTDNVKMKSKIRFKSNQDLSVKRAKSVNRIFTPALTDQSRVKVDGRGPDKPIASNKTASGRAQNRRVEIMLLREQ